MKTLKKDNGGITKAQLRSLADSLFHDDGYDNHNWAMLEIVSNNQLCKDIMFEFKKNLDIRVAKSTDELFNLRYQNN